MEKLDKRTIEILEKILKLLQDVGDEVEWNYKEKNKEDIYLH
ncbi:hypothetical protein [Inediibacterium massiliense]|nr:hypothetical protein [Inediibacterium massiliense]